MRRRQFFSNGYRRAQNPDEFVADIHDVIDNVMERAMDAALKFADQLPWSAEEITKHVDAFVNRHVPGAERCAEERWDDTR
jgi:hypothetical protein